MQDLESLRGLVTSLIKDIERLERISDRAEMESRTDEKDKGLLDMRIVVLERRMNERFDTIDGLLKTIRQEVYEKLGEVQTKIKENRRSIIGIIITLATGGYFVGREVDFKSLLVSLFGFSK